jgi:hypothetical protein
MARTTIRAEFSSVWGTGRVVGPQERKLGRMARAPVIQATQPGELETQQHDQQDDNQSSTETQRSTLL